MRGAIPVLAMLLLAGCQSDAERKAAETGDIDVSNATMADVSRLTKAARGKLGMQPGLWETEIKLVSTDLSSAPEEQRQPIMAALIGQERSATRCAKASDVKPVDIEMLERVGGTCTFPRYINSGGRIDVAIECANGEKKVAMAVKGTMSKTAYDVTIDQANGTPGEPDHVSFKMRATGLRKGACKATG